MGKAFETVACLEGLARVAAAQGRPERAARLLGASAALREEMGTPLSPMSGRITTTPRTPPARRWAEEAFEAAWAVGRATPFDESILDALDAA